ncbi:MAG: hypothetical protein OXR72_17985 [Gemmatimonadota bacterium]|nr:hypothetical protein [Gemmatimonadota bacterium]
MNEHDFARLAASVKQAGEITRGTLKPGRTMQVDPADIRSNTKGHDKSQQEPFGEIET